MPKITSEQHAKLIDLKNAIVAAHDAMPDHRGLGLLHGMAERLVKADQDSMNEDQFQALGGGTDKTVP